MGNDSEGRSTRTETKLVTIDSTLKDIREQLNGILIKVTSVEERLSNQDKKIEVLEKVIKDYANMKKEIDLIKIENVELRKKVLNSEIMEENKLLRENRNALEIHGTQRTVNEDLKQTAIKLGDAAKVVLSKEEIVDCYRLGKRDKNGAIFVRFATPQKRDEYLQKTKKIRPTSRLIGQEPRDNKIYINEALIPSRKYLFYKTKQLVQEKKWKSIWTYAGAIYLKMEQDGNPIKIERLEELEILVR